MTQDKQQSDNPDLMKELPDQELENLEQTLAKSDENAGS